MHRTVHLDATVASRVRLRVIEYRENESFHSAWFDVAETPAEPTPSVSRPHAGVRLDLPDVHALHAVLAILKPLEGERP